MRPMVNVYANGPTCALTDARIAFGWSTENQGGMPLDFDTVDNEYVFSDLVPFLEELGLTVSVFAAPPQD